MLVLALDTTTRAGSLAVARDGELLEVFVGGGDRTHASRLPGDLVACLARHGLSLADVDVFAVAAGPGSFTGLRIGIATIQGLAFAHAKPVVAVSALDALAFAARAQEEARGGGTGFLVAAWMDAQRHEVFAALYGPRTGAGTPPDAAGLDELSVLETAEVGDPSAVLDGWADRLASSPATVFAGDGAMTYRDLLRGAGVAGLRLVEPVPPIAPAIAALARRVAARGGATAPHGVRPIYVRRPDAELARDRRLAAAPPRTSVPPAGDEPPR